MQKRKPAWRRAGLTYGEMRRVGASDPEAHLAAVAAVRAEHGVRKFTQTQQNSVPAER